MTTKTAAPNGQDVTAKFTELGETAAANAKLATRDYLDAYEKGVFEAVDKYEQAVADSKIEELQQFAATQATLTRDITKAYVTAARKLTS